ncbi:serine protease [Desulfuromonas versatilis]|uniref:Serine protease n=1 Tax=Desulfuromonas versatilis TaxID=2802975 RepID=A0ABN6DZK5_9BACT|nr:nodulation protein NfeD [Desulfuromonas versatilis]BCR05538.1 serine protease [Desulfuromonas versatilis]
MEKLWKIWLVLLGVILLPGGGGPVDAQPLQATSPVIRVVEVADVINPVIAGFLVDQLQQANSQQAKAFLIRLDTPGGLDTAMRTIIQGILGSRIPVIVYVAPSGARAASAGALITLAADFAVMAPGTNLGAAHPVAIGSGGAGGQNEQSTMMDKVLNDAVAYARSIAEQRGRNVDWAERIVRESISTPASEALELKVIDLIAENDKQLLEGLDGRRYLREGQGLTLHTAGAELVVAEMGWRQKILNTVSNPNVAYMLLMLGILGIFFEISQPGVILPGAIGALALLLAFFGFQTIPVNYVGVLLILLAVVLFVLEIKVISYGMLTVGGIVSLAFGSLILVDTPEPYMQISWEVILVTVAVTSGFFIIALYFVVKTQKTRFVSGAEGMAGERGEALTDIHETGRVFVHGEYWDAFSSEAIPRGAVIEVVQMARNMRLEVRAAERRTSPGPGSESPGENLN